MTEIIPQSTVTNSTMRVVYLSIVFLFSREIRSVRSLTTDPRIFRRSRSSDLSPQWPSGSKSNLCDGTKINAGEPDAHSACHNKCLAVKAEISTIYNTHPNYKTIRYLHSRCGMVTEGKCNTAAYCWCNTPKGSKEQRRTTVSICLNGIQIVRKFTNAVNAILAERRTNYQEMGEQVEAVDMYQSPSSRPTTRSRTARSRIARPRTARSRRPNPRFCCGDCGTGRTDSPPLLSQQEEEEENRRSRPRRPNSSLGASTSSPGPSVPPSPVPRLQEEEDFNSRQDGDPDGMRLVTDVRVEGRDVRALVDTGSDFSLIHESFAGNIVPLGNRALSSESGQKINILGKTTINLEIKKGVNVLLTGYVTDRKHAIVLGTNFFVAYAAKIRILDQKIEIFTGQTTETITTKFRAGPSQINMMSMGRTGYYTAVQISVRVNEIDTRMVIDTGSAITFVNKYFVAEPNLYPASMKVSMGGGNPVGFKWSTHINLQVESNSFTLPVFVPDFKTKDNFLTGNDFNRMYVELIDYKSNSVTLTFPDSVKITVPAFVIKGQ